MRAVNLLPREIVPERAPLKETLPLLGAAAVPLVAGCLVVIGYSRAHVDAQAQAGRVAAMQLEVDRAKPKTVATTIDTTPLVTQRSARRAALQDVLSKQMPWDRALGDLARVLPSTVWLNDLTVTSPTPADQVVVAPAATTTTPSGSTPPPAPAPAPSSASQGFTIDGFAYTNDDVALLLQRLQLLPTLTGVTLDSTATSTIGEKTVVQFTIVGSVVAPTPAVGAQT